LRTKVVYTYLFDLTWDKFYVHPLFLVALDICVEAIYTNVTCRWNLLTEQAIQV
jgi:hypothetical protein